jgi:hypothetical protein
MIRALLICFAVFFFRGTISAQHKEREFLDSNYVYRKIEDFSNKRKATKLLYSLVFRPVTPKPETPVTTPKKAVKPLQRVKYSFFEGKIIRNIHIVTYDPFGYNAKDTSSTPDAFLLKAGNALHVKTWSVKIRNMLMVKRYDTFDSLRVKESERLVRSQTFIREIVTTPVLTEGDSVDIYFRVYDVWSILITGALTQTMYMIDGKDKNFMGTGHQLSAIYKQNLTSGKNTFTGNYIIPNIYNTYINASLGYYLDEHKNYYQSISLNRSFYSVFTSWAGGISLQRSLTREILYDFDSTAFMQRYRRHSQDYWLGRSWQFRGETEEQRSTSFISSGRYLRVRFPERASEEFDSLHLHPNEDFYLAGIGISRRQYKHDNYIFKYGFVEDVPTGRAYSIVAGYQIRDRVTRWYGGARVYMANYHKWGYFNMYLEYGTFFNGKKTEEGCFSTGINYFSNIIRLGRWKLRQFIKPQYTIGFDRKSYDQLSLNTDPGIRGFNSSGLSGTEKLTLTFQLQSYAPWNILGFRFGPYITCSFGMLGNEKRGFSRAPLYSSYGIGLLIRNEYLIMNTFQVSLVYYPFIPGAKNDVFKVNPVKASDFGFRGFDISQPSTISYQ